MEETADSVFGNQKVFPERCLKIEAAVPSTTLVLNGTQYHTAPQNSAVFMRSG